MDFESSIYVVGDKRMPKWTINMIRSGELRINGFGDMSGENDEIRYFVDGRHVFTALKRDLIILDGEYLKLIKE